jgi:hypothetical protein
VLLLRPPRPREVVGAWEETSIQQPPPPLCSLPSLRRKTTSRAEEEERTGTRRGVGVATANLRARSGRTSSDPRTRRGEAVGEEEAADSGEERRTGIGLPCSIYILSPLIDKRPGDTEHTTPLPLLVGPTRTWPQLSLTRLEKKLVTKKRQHPMAEVKSGSGSLASNGQRTFAPFRPPG